ncbi:Hypothetical_protein [Hexamita inflata]|uniref:Hypothetical_protein n=1 Tax=Hexamita inflata TaxID=28002 RepID=A0AA86VRR4_9EUKA|nr:Hypothetical protein HINF_LOCUS62493 [Hexamita inflata]
MIPSSRELDEIAGVVDHMFINENSAHQNTQPKREQLFQNQNIAQESTIGNQTEILKQQLYDLQSQILEANNRFQNEQCKLKLAHENIKLLTQPAEMKISKSSTTDLRTIQSMQHNCAKEQHAMLDQSCFSYKTLNLSQENQNELLEKQIQQMQKQLELTNKKVINEQLKLKLVLETTANLKGEVQNQISSSVSKNNPTNQQDYNLKDLKDVSETLQNVNHPVQQIINKRQNILNQQQILRLALKQTLNEAGYEVESLSEKEIVKIVHQLTSKEKRQLRFWDRVAQLCCRSKQQIVHFYRQTYKSSVYKNKPNLRAQVDNQEQLIVSQQSDIQNSQKVNTTQKAGESVIIKKRVRESHCSQRMLFALRQVLTQIGYQIETASDKEICNHVDQISFSQKIQYKFWDHVSVLCKQSKDQLYCQYSRFKQHNFTDKLNYEDQTAINEYMQQNREIPCDQTVDTVLKTVLKDKIVSFSEVQKYIQLLRQKQFESGFINPQTTQNILRNQTTQMQLQNQTYSTFQNNK